VHVSSIHLYPVKGCYRTTVERAVVEPWGLAGDRRWLIVRADTGEALTQRDLPVMTQIRPAFSGDELVLAPQVRVPSPLEGELVPVRVWSSVVTARRACVADAFLSSVLGLPAWLVWLDDPTRRTVDPLFGGPEDRVSFADGYPLLLANTASLDALNDWIAESGSVEGPLPMNRFRPNVVISGAPAWAEDAWTGGCIRIGSVPFRVPKNCARCVVTTTDQETGERGREPLRTLGRHRNVDQRLLFATNLIPDGVGEIAVGDPVTELREWGR
jgi:uncharacterized protein YcbX